MDNKFRWSFDAVNYDSIIRKELKKKNENDMIMTHIEHPKMII